ncbi:hypothetical protein BCIN_10g03370 [Botrytis cinerea B05.10]|uniref:Uncharacterized protein n=3 Tax=Botryotinia fuckeliana TaxID=40559 RepID=A0A384JUR4_BOTFB|nr:hypothetical protein BCIN_10g03370 [Botrytis cinerea B05.10]ATZ54329.1 hypothetical protein BCIN_10g03370 [Botrytis cinerea B05.10]EMR89635.1 putative ankyrin repeat protein [Botrytis cinerea BcDW1]CCD45004.1 hypothetical protein BofuT4_P051130.1 [Botrytis cinerea T4]
MGTHNHEGATATKHGDSTTSLIDRKDKVSNATNIIKSPTLSGRQETVTDSEASKDVEMPDAPPEDTDVKSDSEAETIVLEGKNGHSPSKTRKSIKHEDNSDEEDIRKPSESRKRETLSLEALSQTENHLGRRKRLKIDPSESSKSQPDNGRLSNLQNKRHSSLPKSTVPELRSEESSSPPLSNLGSVDKATPVERAFPRNKLNPSDSDEDHVDHEERKLERLRNSALNNMQRKGNIPSLSINMENALGVRKERSESPHHGRSHKRGHSTQYPSKSIHSSGHRKGRIPPPLLSTEYQSDDSSASGRSHPRSSRPRQRTASTIRDLATPVTVPQKKKKHLDSSGATMLFQFVRKNNLAGVMEEFNKHPEDLNQADNALNTPLHGASLVGYDKIVEFLLSKDCNVDVVNDLGDTPLHDAIDNGHVEVVRLLLEYGADPRKAKKAGGDEPSDLAAAYVSVPEDEENTRRTRKEMQQLIEDAKSKHHEDTVLSEQTPGENADHEPYSRNSPHHSPTSEHPGISNGLRARSYRTTHRDLYRDHNNAEMLREACRNGDHPNIYNWLDVNQKKGKDPTSLLIAAKAGDKFAVDLLLGLGNYDCDPEPLRGVEFRWSTPMLCAIHKGHIDVIKCLLSGDFDPTRRLNNKTYYEHAQERERGSSNYESVVETLRDAFNTYSKPVKSSPSKSRSPKLHRDSDRGRDSRRPVRTTRDRSSPSRKRSPSKSMRSLEVELTRRASSDSLHPSLVTHSQARRGPGRPRKEESNASHPTSDTESTPLGPPKKKLQAPKVTEADAAAMSSENEPPKPRRKLVSGKDLRGERDRQGRGSIASNVSSISVQDRDQVEESKRKDGKQKTTIVAQTTELANEDQVSKPSIVEMASDKSEKHDKTKGTKRDISKDRLASIRNDKSPIKRQRQSTTPPRTGTLDTIVATETDGAPSKRQKVEGLSKHIITDQNTSNSCTDHPAPNLDTTSQDKSTLKTTKENTSRFSSKLTGENETCFNKENEEIQAAKKPELLNPVDVERKRQAKLAREAREAKQQAKEVKEAREAKAVEEAREAKEKEAKEEEAREAKEKEAKEREVREREAKEAKEAQEAEEAQEKLAIEEAAKRAQEEEERKSRHAQEERDKAEQRRIYDDQKRIEREKLEQNRAAAQERERSEKARQAREKEEQRLSKLPLLLRVFDQLPQAETLKIASLSKFRIIQGYRYDTIRPEAIGSPSAREQWMLNTDVALLLGEKDLELSRYTAWERIPLDMDAKEAIWPLAHAKYSRDPFKPNILVPSDERAHLAADAKPLFLGLDLFFIKVSEFMFVVPNFPHLRDSQIAIEYQELVPLGATPVNRYEQDSDHDPSQPFWPEPQIYIRGNLVTPTKIETKTSTKPFPEPKVSRRENSNEKELLALALARTQMLWEQRERDEHDGITPPHSDRSRSLNEDGLIQESISGPINISQNTDLSNGTFPLSNGTVMHEVDILD